MKKIFTLISIALVVFGAARVYYHLTDDFRIANMTYQMNHHQDWEIPPLTDQEEEKLDTILNQKFSYLGKGSQSYVFSSEDGNYVIKFFKFKHLKPNIFVNSLPSIPPFKNYKEKQTSRKERKLYGVFDGYRLAYEVHKKESGLIYIHLNQTDNLKKSVVVKDKMGFERKIDLDPIVFIIQEKAVPSRTVIRNACQSGQLALAKKRVSQIFDLYMVEYEKGIVDHDHGVLHNTGFIGDRVIHYDIGKMHDESNINRQEDLFLVANRINTWINKEYPQHYHEMVQFMKKEITSRCQQNHSL